jgi:hypothetical protein
VDRSVRNDKAVASIAAMDDLPPNQDTLAAVTKPSALARDLTKYSVAIMNFNARVVAFYESLPKGSARPEIPPDGCALIGTGRSANWLRENAVVGEMLTYAAVPKYISILDAPQHAYTVFCDPNNPDVRSHEMDVVREIASNYAVDGIVFDDRLRYAGLNADFSARSRAAFEKFVGAKITWPGDVFLHSPYPGQDPIRGPYYQQWLNWRAGNITSWLKEAASTVRELRPSAQVAVYVGSWYGQYDKVAENWAAPDFEAPYPWSTPEFRATGFADTLDWITTGCYNYTSSLADAVATAGNVGGTVEAAGQLSNRVVNDAAWTYAGLYTLTYHGHPDSFARAIKAAAASTQGVMVFDLSDVISYNWWPILTDAFAASPAQPPSADPALLKEVRRLHQVDKANGVPQPPLPPYQGILDLGF